jgi:hypothetical protein
MKAWRIPERPITQAVARFHEGLYCPLIVRDRHESLAGPLTAQSTLQHGLMCSLTAPERSTKALAVSWPPRSFFEGLAGLLIVSEHNKKTWRGL